MVAIIFRKRNIRKKKKQTALPQTIGVCGMAHNIGTTNLCLSTANYLANKRLQATAYLELNATREIAQLNPSSSPGRFTYMGIDFYPDATLRQLPELLQLKYSYFVLDFGVPNAYTFPEFLRCDLKFTVCSYSPWKRQQYDNFYRHYNKNNELHHTNVKVLGNYGIKDTGNKNCETIPFLPNPFQLAPGEFTFFDRLLERN